MNAEVSNSGPSKYEAAMLIATTERSVTYSLNQAQ
jgi:hypothetical protein